VTRSQVFLIGGLIIGVVVVWVAVARSVIPAVTGPEAVAVASPSPDGSSDPGLDGASSTAMPDQHPATVQPLSPTPEPTAATTRSPVAPSSTGTPKPAPTRTSRPADPPGDPRLLYAEFLLRLDDARDEVAPLNAALTTAAQTGDKPVVRDTSVDILRFADRERDWLAGHPPADCYAGAHEAAGSMLEAYATVADRAIDWTARTGLAALQALARVAEAADDAQVALTELAHALETTTCRA
jgi:hypothetical protein